MPAPPTHAIHIALPVAVPETVREQFGRHVQQLDEMLAEVTSSSQQLALIEFIQVHLRAQAAVIELASRHSGD